MVMPNYTAVLAAALLVATCNQPKTWTWKWVQHTIPALCGHRHK